MIINYIVKYILIFIILLNSLYRNSQNKNDFPNIINDHCQYSSSFYLKNITHIPDIYITLTKIDYYYSRVYKLKEIGYYMKLTDKNNNLIKPSDLSLLYDLHIICCTYSLENGENIYYLANIYENQYFFCIDYIQFSEQMKFGVKIYKLNEIDEQIEYNEIFFFTDKLFNINQNFQNNNRFNINYIYDKYNKLLLKKKKYENKRLFLKKPFNLKSSFLQPPLSTLKRDITQVKGKWYFKNIYGTYFCFCRAESCINLNNFNQDFQNCKYYFYLTMIDNNRDLFPKTHYLLSDFFDEKIDSVDAFPVFVEMIKEDLNVHYLTMSSKIYSNFCLNDAKCLNEMHIIYGIRKINGDTLEKYLELLLKLKVVVTAEKYECIDNLFYNIEYITYIFLGHGVTYIKSYLYNDYLSPKRYNKILLPPSQRFISLALEAGWKKDDIIKIGYPRWDFYNIHSTSTLPSEINNKGERSIFMMFTWRKVKKGECISDLYYKNIYNIFNSRKLNRYLQKYNVKLFFCYHHAMIQKKKFKESNNIRFVFQNEISTLLMNSSLIITDFSSILFDAIVQKKPLILYIPDGLDTNLKDIYSYQYYETITKLKNGMIFLIEIFLYLKDVINKIIYYIKNNFALENEKLLVYKEFRLKNKGNTRKFINYLETLK